MMMNLKGLVGLVCLTSLHATKMRWGIGPQVAGMDLEGGMVGRSNPTLRLESYSDFAGVWLGLLGPSQIWPVWSTLTPEQGEHI